MAYEQLPRLVARLNQPRDWRDVNHDEVVASVPPAGVTGRHEVAEATTLSVAAALQSQWMASSAELASRTQLPRGDVDAALGLWVQAGRAVFDLPTGRYAWRELTREPLPIVALNLALGLLAIWKHKPNLERLLKGTEHRFGRKPAGPAGEKAPTP